jgi:hypothetical protein
MLGAERAGCPLLFTQIYMPLPSNIACPNKKFHKQEQPRNPIAVLG